MCFEMYGLDSAHFLSAPGLAWETALRKTKRKLDLVTDINMSLMVEKGIRDGICHAFHLYSKANNKYIKNHVKNKESFYLSIGRQLICMDGH